MSFVLKTLIGVLLYDIATKLGSAFEEKQDCLTKYVLDEKIKTPQQLERAIKYIQDWTRGTKGTNFSLEELERCCGVKITLFLKFNAT